MVFVICELTLALESEFSNNQGKYRLHKRSVKITLVNNKP
jgi:hypothetical protein